MVWLRYGNVIESFHFLFPFFLFSFFFLFFFFAGVSHHLLLSPSGRPSANTRIDEDWMEDAIEIQSSFIHSKPGSWEGRIPSSGIGYIVGSKRREA